MRLGHEYHLKSIDGNGRRLVLNTVQSVGVVRRRNRTKRIRERYGTTENNWTEKAFIWVGLRRRKLEIRWGRTATKNDAALLRIVVNPTFARPSTALTLVASCEKLPEQALCALPRTSSSALWLVSVRQPEGRTFLPRFWLLFVILAIDWSLAVLFLANER
jgi:hypothetical protein